MTRISDDFEKQKNKYRRGFFEVLGTSYDHINGCGVGGSLTTTLINKLGSDSGFKKN